MKKELTICMPVYNGEKYLDESIGSVLGQTYSNFKFLIYDDGSTDGSVEKVKSFNDKRIELIEGKENHGGIYARTELIKAIDTKYCMWIDQDDRYCRNDAFEYAVKCIKSNDYDIVNFCKIRELDKNGNVNPNVHNRFTYNDFSYSGDKLFEKFYPIDAQHYFWSKIFNTDILVKSIPEERILNGRFCTDDNFFSAMWYYCCKNYCHLTFHEPLYEYKVDNGFWGKKLNDFSAQRVGDLCLLQYNCFISLYNRMSSIRNLNNNEIRNLVLGSNLFYVANIIKYCRKNFGDEYGDKLAVIFHAAFCNDGVHLFNGIDGFAFPDVINHLENTIKRKDDGKAFAIKTEDNNDDGCVCGG